jgi:2-haloacid dehalogenase
MAMDQTRNIKNQLNVVFDIGNVLLKWDPRILYRKIFSTEAEVNDFLTRVLPPEWNLEQDRGRSWREAEDLQIALFPDYADAIRAFRGRWKETIPGSIEGTVVILEELKKAGVPLYAITNFASDTFREAQKRFPYLADSFIDIVISGDEKLLKPDPAIYHILLERQKLKAEDCIFIDDSMANVKAAATVGFHALQFASPEQFRSDLRNLGLPI